MRGHLGRLGVPCRRFVLGRPAPGLGERHHRGGRQPGSEDRRGVRAVHGVRPRGAGRHDDGRLQDAQGRASPDVVRLCSPDDRRGLLGFRVHPADPGAGTFGPDKPLRRRYPATGRVRRAGQLVLDDPDVGRRHDAATARGTAGRKHHAAERRPHPDRGRRHAIRQRQGHHRRVGPVDRQRPRAAVRPADRPVRGRGDDDGSARLPPGGEAGQPGQRQQGRPAGRVHAGRRHRQGHRHGRDFRSGRADVHPDRCGQGTGGRRRARGLHGRPRVSRPGHHLPGGRRDRPARGRRLLGPVHLRRRRGRTREAGRPRERGRFDARRASLEPFDDLPADLQGGQRHLGLACVRADGRRGRRRRAGVGRGVHHQPAGHGLQRDAGRDGAGRPGARLGTAAPQPAGRRADDAPGRVHRPAGHRLRDRRLRSQEPGVPAGPHRDLPRGNGRVQQWRGPVPDQQAGRAPGGGDGLQHHLHLGGPGPGWHRAEQRRGHRRNRAVRPGEFEQLLPLPGRDRGGPAACR